MRLTPPPAMQAAASSARAPLANLLASYPGTDAPGVANTSNRLMQSVAKRANTRATRTSVLHDYLATV